MTNIFLDSYIFRDINEYTDLRNLCDTCLSLSKLKKYINYKLNKQYSLMYYNDILFKTKILNKIYNPCKQLYLNLNFNVNTLRLCRCNFITDITVLKNINSLNLSYCKNVRDISVLRNVKILDLSSCDKIINVSALTNVHTLNLTNCYNITNVSALKTFIL
jgi:hypothetical protein